MPIPANVARCSIVGHLPQGEQFNTSFWLAGTAVESSAQANVIAAEIADDFGAIASNPFTAMLATGAGYDEVRTYFYPTGGPAATYIGAAPISGEQGSVSSSLLPLQSCFVGTLRTGLAGRRHRGRMYFPAIAFGLVAHQATAAWAQTLSSALGGFLTAVNQNAAIAGQVAVLSQVAGETQLVTSVEFDTKVDIQRRHANRQLEVGQGTAAVAA
jgi:hypothetical protein